MPLESTQKNQEEQEHDIDKLLVSEQYAGCEEDVIADLCKDIYGIHPRDLKDNIPGKGDDINPNVRNSTDEGARSSIISRQRKVSSFEMANPLSHHSPSRISIL